ncbi:MAG: hypothetical protein AMJ65_13585 [Phycisphaerae bacterium SG8_4]|nr:MAG: hypothetical protein AMJ65_13585 [Phycisphaerae bacterium SG8_4]
MCKKLACLILFVSVLIRTGVCKAADPGLVGWWRFDEGSGTVARDSSGNGHDGVLKGDPQWVFGRTDSALEFDGSGDYVEVGSVGISGLATRTITGWAKASTTNISSWTTVFGFAPSGSTDGTYFDIEVDDSGNYVVNVQGWQGAFGPVDTQWHHFAATFSGTGGSWYLDGRLVDRVDGDVGTIDQFVIGARLSNSNFFGGVVDDVRVYDRPLELDDIKKAMAGPRPYDPFPADGDIYEDTWVSLTWFAGEGATSHDVYLGDNLDDVNVGTAEAFQGNQAEAYFAAGFPPNAFAEGLVPGTTYYWRIDEIQADGVTIQRGDVWSFTIPSKIAHYPDPPDGAEFVDPNTVFAWTPGFEAKLHFIYMGTNFDDVNNAAGGIPWGFTTYSPAVLEPEKVYYWRVDEFDAVETHKGEVWAFTTPGAVGNPQPANGAVDVQMIATLSWTPADNATSHELYFGTDADAVDAATATSPEYVGPKALGAESYNPGTLAWHSAYAWRVDEVYPDRTVKGLVWTFTTADFVLVDDFESYNDIDPPEPASNRVFDQWIDGFLNPTTNGALIGHSLPPYAEQIIVHSGAQSMPYSYDNALKTSEATLTLVHPRDWTEQGVAKLSLWFRGDPANASERMFVALNGTSVVYHDDASATQLPGWTKWVIDLEAFAGVDLTNVNTITIGFGTKSPGAPGPGGSGRMYFDDIRLTR